MVQVHTYLTVVRFHGVGTLAWCILACVDHKSLL